MVIDLVPPLPQLLFALAFNKPAVLPYFTVTAFAVVVSILFIEVIPLPVIFEPTGPVHVYVLAEAIGGTE